MAAGRICHMCDREEIGDEFHYLFNCTHITIKEKRRSLLSNYYLHHATVIKMNDLLNLRPKKNMRIFVNLLNM